MLGKREREQDLSETQAETEFKTKSDKRENSNLFNCRFQFMLNVTYFLPDLPLFFFFVGFYFSNSQRE